MEKFLKGKTLYIEDSKDGRTLRFVIANITRCENGVLATSEENEAMRKELAEYRPLGKPGKIRASLHRCEFLEKQHAQALEKMEDYLASLGVENEYHSFMGAVARIVKI